ncbi:MAG: class I SAM-dependent methyltransferase [Proteobacteria bacterium]|nr:class I SAM-dependent methyltransferase [Pseudomonadota bacterium]
MSTPPRPDPNAAQVEYWNAAAGQTWARLHDDLDRQIGALGIAAMDRLTPAPGERLLDVGCGCGHTTVELARRVGPRGAVTGVDLSEPMLAVARAREPVRDGGRLTWRLADVQTAELGQRCFDGAYSRFGVMFFSDPVAAFANVRAALRPDGRLAFVCWRALADNPWMREPLEAARPWLPPPIPPAPRAPGPFAFADETWVAEILRSAGFVGLGIERLDRPVGAGDLEVALRLALRLGPLGAALREHPALKQAVEEPVRAALARHLTADGVRLDASVWIVTARRDRD